VPPFPKPDFEHPYSLPAEIAALRKHRDERNIPAKRDDRLLLATWNIANLGVQERKTSDYELIAQIVSWFDIVAVQEVADNLAGLRAIRDQLPPRYRLVISDVAGNRERAAFVYDAAKVEPLEETGRLSIPPAQFRFIKMPGVSRKFDGFDRPPFIGTFRAGRFSFEALNVHLFFGSDKSKPDIERRTLETFAIARWCDITRDSEFAYLRDIIALGDFNLPEFSESDPIFRTLRSRGLELPAHKSQVGGSSLQGLKHYDQVAVFPNETVVDAIGVFDYDNVIFASLFKDKTLPQFLSYLRYYVSDHRPMWAQFTI
jgi:endonuclease/exonuclease/phosphatase family metal-dependent hydrolase